MNVKQMSFGIILSYISIAVRLISGLLYMPIVLNKLGQSQYGVYSLCTSFIGYLTILNAGVNAAYIRFYVQERVTNEKTIDKLNGLFCRIFVILSVVGLVGGILISGFSPLVFGSKITVQEHELVQKCFLLLSFTVSIEIFACMFSSFITANEEFIFLKIMDIISAVFSPVLTIPFLLKGYNCTVIISVRLFLSVLLFLTEFIFCRKKLKIRFAFCRAEKNLKNNIFQFVAFIALQSIMDQLNWQIDKFILARTQGTSEISIYSVGSTFNNYFILIGGAVSGVFIAEINRTVATGDENRLNSLFRKTCRLFKYIIGFIIIAFLIFGRAFILRWAGREYGDSFSVAWMLMTPVTFSLIMGLGQDIARAKNKHQLQIIINLIVCIINMLVSIPLAIRFGAVGSALGTFAAEICLCLIIQPIYYKKKLGLDVKSVFCDILRFLPGAIIPLAYGMLIHYTGILKSSYGSIAFHGAVFTVIYLISILLFSMRNEDRLYIFDIIKKRKL